MKSANDQTSFIIKKNPNIRTGVSERNGSYRILCMGKEKEEKKQVGETESELEKKRHHTQHTKE